MRTPVSPAQAAVSCPRRRSYLRNPGLGADFIAAQQASGVPATGKHFPGLGTATKSQNTDERPVTLTVSRADLRGIDEYPNRAAIASGSSW